MADLDALLEDAAGEHFGALELNVDEELKAKKQYDEVKPWLAFSSNIVPKETRDLWSQMVKIDTLAALSLPEVTLQPSEAYYSWENPSPLVGPNKLLAEQLRVAAIQVCVCV